MSTEQGDQVPVELELVPLDEAPTAAALRRAVEQEMTREECGCGCPVCVALLGAELYDTDGCPPWYWGVAPPSPCRQEPS